MRIEEIQQKSRALGTGIPRCMQGSGAVSLNVVRGCLIRCAYCVYRSLPGSPKDGHIILYTGIVDQASRELDRAIKRGSPPSVVLVNTGTDCFMGERRVADLAVECIRACLDRGVPVHLTTKGRIPEALYEVLGRRPERVRVTFSIASLKNDFHQTFEPRAAKPSERLAMAARLTGLGVEVRFRVVPLIPMMNDGEEELEELLRAIHKAGVRRFSAAYLQMYKGVPERLNNMIGASRAILISQWYQRDEMDPDRESQPVTLPPSELRLKTYRHLWRFSKKLNLRMAVCGCRNPDLHGGRCYDRFNLQGDKPTPPKKQLDLL